MIAVWRVRGVDVHDHEVRGNEFAQSIRRTRVGAFSFLERRRLSGLGLIGCPVGIGKPVMLAVDVRVENVAPDAPFRSEFDEQHFVFQIRARQSRFEQRELIAAFIEDLRFSIPTL